MVQETSAVKRSDLTLRCRYIGLETEIYQIDKYRYAIYCKNYSGNFDKLQADFNHSIRQMGTQVELTQSVPQKYLLKVKPIQMSNVVDGFKGAYITRPDIENAIVDRFPDVEIYGIHIVEGLNFAITVEVAPETPQETMAEMEAVFTDIDFGTDKIAIRHSSDKISKPKAMYDISQDVIQLGINKQLPFTLDEADYWFANADKIYSGSLLRDALPKFYSQTASCCLDCSMYNPVNIRSVLLLYSTVYLILPLRERFEAFLAEQNLSRNDLLDLAARGNVTFILSNLENRYDTQFLLDAYRCNPLSIIGRRGINTVVASLLSETRKKYLAHFPDSVDVASSIREIAEQSGDPTLRIMENLLSWPIIEPAESFSRLNSCGPLSFGLMGLDRVLLPLLSKGDQQTADSLSLLLHFAGNTVFLSSAFNATLFHGEPEKNAPLNQSFHIASSIVSDLLQLYWYDPETIKDVRSVREQAFSENQAINLFDCKKNVSAVKVAELADKYKTYDGFKRIIDSLGQMDKATRKRQITEYNDTLLDLAATPSHSSKLDFILSASSFFPLPYVLSLITATMSLAKGQISATDFIQRQIELKRIEDCLKAAGKPQSPQFIEDIYTLDKISRVAGLR